MISVIRGVVHGKTIALEDDSGLTDGQIVELTIRPLAPSVGRQPGEGLIRTEGALADDPYWDAIMEQIHRERKNDTRQDDLE
jgi:hypothetical protein